jgi:hypothetical protein
MSGCFSDKPGPTPFWRREKIEMNPLMVLWLLVFGSAVILSAVFFLAENYAHIFGNFWVLLGILLGGYALVASIGWMVERIRKRPVSPEKK